MTASIGIMVKRFGGAFVGVAATAVAPLGVAQDWSVYGGGAARIEYNDNYFFTPADKQSAFTGSITPFVTAARRTENSIVTAVLTVGENKVWGLSPSVDYLSGSFGLDGSLHEARSTWAGHASFVRAVNLQNQASPDTTALVRAFTDAAAVNGSYSYTLTERWSVGATAGVYNNSYNGVASGATLSNNHGYFASSSAGYAFSDSTQFTFAAGYSKFLSDVARTDELTATAGVAYQFSPRLTVSGSIGAFRASTDVVQEGLPATGTRQHDSGPLYGGNISYAISEQTQFGANLSENLTPNGTGTLTRTDSAGAFLTHRFSDRLTGRLGANYNRTTFASEIVNSPADKYWSGEAGVSYLLAERWKLDAGYRYSGARYGHTAGEPSSNVVFVSIGYNWPGGSFTDWIGQRPNVQGLPGAGGVSLPERSPGSAPPDASTPGASPFDPFTIP